MKQWINRVIVTLLTIASLSPIAVLAATQYVEGGQWNDGTCFTFTCGYSDYYHDTRYHTSTVTHPESGSNSAGAYGGNWSQAKLFRIPPTGMSYYYNVY